MWALLIAAMALSQTDGSAWRAGWQKAVARADLRDRLRKHQITHDEYLKAHLRLLTPQEEAEMRAFFEQEAVRVEARTKELERKAEILERVRRRALEKPDKGKPPPDVK
jgi:hypothetical protein